MKFFSLLSILFIATQVKADYITQNQSPCRRGFEHHVACLHYVFHDLNSENKLVNIFDRRFRFKPRYTGGYENTLNYKVSTGQTHIGGNLGPYLLIDHVNRFMTIELTGEYGRVPLRHKKPNRKTIIAHFGHGQSYEVRVTYRCRMFKRRATDNLLCQVYDQNKKFIGYKGYQKVF